ncbi:MAG: hypothetical protein ACD_79C00270G0006 [uncultured bacterium]|nr:MAG: hypothetical protein ACD_79C00270G0006 [uncultured bacterium]
MEILINELSLDCQFYSEKDFIENGLTPIVPVLKLLNEQNFSLMKKYDFYETKVTSSKTIYNILTEEDISRSYDIIRKFKSLLTKLFVAPFWQDNQRHSDEDIYILNNEKINGSSIAESCERDKVILSFFHECYLKKNISIFKNNISFTINNIFKVENYYDFLNEKGLLSVEEVFKIKFSGTKLNFSTMLPEYGFALLNDKNIISTFLQSFEKFIKMNWNDILKDKGFNYKQYNDATLFKNSHPGKTIYKFRVSEKYRCFGYRECDSFYVIRFELDHKLSDKG